MSPAPPLRPRGRLARERLTALAEQLRCLFSDQRAERRRVAGRRRCAELGAEAQVALQVGEAARGVEGRAAGAPQATRGTTRQPPSRLAVQGTSSRGRSVRGFALLAARLVQAELRFRRAAQPGAVFAEPGAVVGGDASPSPGTPCHDRARRGPPSPADRSSGSRRPARGRSPPASGARSHVSAVTPDGHGKLLYAIDPRKTAGASCGLGAVYFFDVRRLLATMRGLRQHDHG